MIKINQLPTTLKYTTLVTLLSLSIPSFAKTINLYDQPKADAKVVATIDLATGFMPIYTPKDSGWVKIADPNNGNVGWAKSTDINSAGGPQSSFSFTQSIGTDTKSPVSYRVFQFGQPTNKTSTEQSQNMVKQLQTQQQAVETSMQNMMRDINEFFMANSPTWHATTVPMYMPILIVPVEKNPGVAPPSKK